MSNSFRKICKKKIARSELPTSTYLLLNIKQKLIGKCVSGAIEKKKTVCPYRTAKLPVLFCLILFDYKCRV